MNKKTVGNHFVEILGFQRILNHEGNLISKSDIKGTTSYTYDGLNRLLTAAEPGDKVTSYTYDGAGNRLTETITENGSITATTYEYNGENRLTGTTESMDGSDDITSGFTYDRNGNTLKQKKGSDVIDFTYDNRDQIISNEDLSGLGAGFAYSSTSSYNPEGLRIEKTVTQAGNTDTTRYFYEYSHVVLETDSAGNEIGYNIYGNDLLLARKAEGTVLYYLYNGHGDVTVLVDGSGTEVASYYYGCLWKHYG
jgi:YD repeat-containing protein